MRGNFSRRLGYSFLVGTLAALSLASVAHAQCGGTMIATPNPATNLLIGQSTTITAQFGPLGQAGTINSVVVNLECQNAGGCASLCTDDGMVLQYNGDDTIVGNTCGQALSTGLGNGNTTTNQIAFTFANPINLAVGATCQFSFQVTILSFSNDATPKFITGTAQTQGLCTNGLPLSACGSYLISLADPKINIEKSANPTVTCFGDSVKYTYVVTNPGDVPLHDVVVIDDNGTPGANPPQSDDDFSPTFVGGDTNGNNLLEPSETWTYTFSTTELPVGTTINTATVSGDFTNAVATVTKTDVDTAQVTVKALPVVEVFGEKICNNEGTGQVCAMVTGGTPPYEVCWYQNGVLVPGSCDLVLVDGGQSCLDVNDEGVYCAVAVDADGKGCVSGDTDDACGSIDINPNPLIKVTNDTVCAGSCGDLHATVAGGTAPYAVQWYDELDQPVGSPCLNVQENGQCHLNVCDGATYTAKVVDFKNCEGEDSGVLRFHPLPTCFVNSSRDKICPGQTATLCAIVSSGTPPYTYVWSTGATTQCLIDIDQPGEYSVTVTDSHGCQTECEFELLEHHVDIEVACTPKGEQIELCATVISGRPPITFRWSTGSHDQCILVNSVSPCNAYVVTAIDSNQCSDTAVFQLLDGPGNSCMCPGQPSPCVGDVNDDANVNVSDLLSVINGWGQCPVPPAACTADIAPQPTPDSQVNVSDLLLVINQWGKCR